MSFSFKSSKSGVIFVRKIEVTLIANLTSIRSASRALDLRHILERSLAISAAARVTPTRPHTFSLSTTSVRYLSSGYSAVTFRFRSSTTARSTLN